MAADPPKLDPRVIAAYLDDVDLDLELDAALRWSGRRAFAMTIFGRSTCDERAAT